MEKKETIKNSIKYDYSNPESQKLFEEFTILLTEITRHVDHRQNQDQRIIELENELERVTRVRHMVKMIIKKIVLMIQRYIMYFPKKLLTIIKQAKDKLADILK